MRGDVVVNQASTFNQQTTTTGRPDEQTHQQTDQFIELFIGLTLAAFVVLFGLVCFLTRYCRHRLIVTDAAKLRRIAPRHCVVPQRRERFRTLIKKLCKHKWSEKGTSILKVTNVAII